MSLKQVRTLLAQGLPAGQGSEDTVRRQWWAALATLQNDFLLTQEAIAGVWLAAPLPALYEPQLLQQLNGWVWAPSELDDLLPPPAALLPAAPGGSRAETMAPHFERLSLEEADGTDPLLIVITPKLQVALCVDGASDARRLVVRFEPAVLSAALSLVNQRLEHSNPRAAQALRQALQRLGSLHSDDSLALQFWTRLAERLAAMAPSVTLQPLVRSPGRAAEATASGSRGQVQELALLEAITHEVRTPLATIRTLIRSLLRRSEITPVVRQRLEQIDGECSEQIDRFGLIFLAAELQRQPKPGSGAEAQNLARTDLSHLLNQLEPLWRRQLQRRSLELSLELAPDLPQVLSDPARLETMLGGLIDRFSRGLPSGAQVRLRLLAAGPRLKLHLSSEAAAGGRLETSAPPPQRELVGPVLSWNPTTGSLQLSRQATQQLFQHLGGRFTERNGSGLTVFFPVAEPVC